MSRQVVDEAQGPKIVETITANPVSEESAFSGGVDKGAAEVLAMAEKALSEARDEIAEEDAANDGGEKGAMSVQGSESTVVDGLVAAGSEANDRDMPSGQSNGVEIEVTQEEKDAFLDSVIRGVRYEAPFSLFGGRVKGVFRSRTNGESAAIDSYARRLVRSGAVATNVEFANMVRICLLVACVKELDGVEYSEMLKDGESGKASVDPKSGGVVDPEWVKMVGYLQSRPDAIVSALMAEIIVFESKYWKMTSKARDENFWKTGESTEG